MDYECNVFVRVRKLPVPVSLIRKTANFVLNKQKRKGGSVSIHCIGMQAMKQLNHTYRGKSKPTDVLSFSIDELEMPGGSHGDFGDIFVCVPYIARQAKEMGVSFREELIRMVLHGILHVLGFDHTYAHEAKQMFSLQETYLRMLVRKKI